MHIVNSIALSHHFKCKTMLIFQSSQLVLPLGRFRVDDRDSNVYLQFVLIKLSLVTVLA